jgi:hypothetical protein
VLCWRRFKIPCAAWPRDSGRCALCILLADLDPVDDVAEEKV